MNPVIDAQSFLRLLNKHGAFVSVGKDENGKHLRIHWQGYQDDFDEDEIDALIETHSATLMSWLEACDGNRDVALGRDLNIISAEDLQIWGDGIVETEGTKIVANGIPQEDTGNLILFEPLTKRVAPDRVQTFCTAWFRNGTKCKHFAFVRGKWKGGVFTPN